MIIMMECNLAFDGLQPISNLLVLRSSERGIFSILLIGDSEFSEGEEKNVLAESKRRFRSPLDDLLTNVDTDYSSYLRYPSNL